MAVERAGPVEPAAGSVPAVAGREFRRVAGRFASGIAVVATTDAGVDYAMTVSAFTSVSLEPLLVLVCVEKTARFHRAVSNRGAWTVSILGADGEAASRWFAEKGRPTGQQFAGHAHHPGPATGLPVLDAAIGVLECRTRAVYDGGDHDIVLGEVVGAWTDDSSDGETSAASASETGAGSDGAPRGPLLHYRGRYFTLGE